MLGLTQILCSSRTVPLKHIVDVAGTELNNVDAVANLLGQRSIRHTARITELWKRELTEEDLKLLEGFKDGSITLDRTDPFPKLGLTPDTSGLLFDLEEFKNLDLTMLEGKLLYKCFVKVYNKTFFDKRNDTVWRSKFALDKGIKPVWEFCISHH